MTLSDLIPGVSEAKAIVGGVLCVALIGFALWVWRVDSLRAHYKAEVAAVQSQLKAESAANTLTSASLKSCMANIDTLNAQSDARAKALTDATNSYHSTIARLNQQSAAEKDKMAYWQGMAVKYQSQAKCPIPADLAAELNR